MRDRVMLGAVVLVTTLGLGGCASTGQIDDLKSQIAAAQAAADKAASAAAAAAADAAAAKSMAADAQATAADAKSTAAAALSKSAETEEKIDRMFKKAMYK